MPNFSAILAGTGSCLPERRLTNDDLSKMVETNDEWIVQRTGIRERRIAGPGETTATLGTAAARRATGAVVLQRSEDPKRGLLYNTLHADGTGGDVMKCMPGSRHPICADMISQEQQFMQIRGREVYKFAVSKFEELIEQAMRACELTKDDVKFIIPHQVNQRIIDSAMEKLGMPPSQAYVNIDKYGNT